MRDKNLTIILILLFLFDCQTKREELVFFPPVVAIPDGACVDLKVFLLENGQLFPLSIEKDCKILSGERPAIEGDSITLSQSDTILELECRSKYGRIEVIGQNSVDFFFSGEYEFHRGVGGGFGSEKLPDIIEGPPEGAGLYSGSLDVLSLGHSGNITLYVPVYNGPGPDFIIFENPFEVIGTSGVYTEPASISVLSVGIEHQFPCNIEDGSGCAGITPVFSKGGCNPSALDPEASGGDSFDLEDLGIDVTNGIKIQDLSEVQDDPDPKAGFDLDAVAILNPPPPDGSNMEIYYKQITIQDYQIFSVGVRFRDGDKTFYPLNFSCTPEGIWGLPVYLLEEGKSIRISCSYGDHFVTESTLSTKQN